MKLYNLFEDAKRDEERIRELHKNARTIFNNCYMYTELSKHIKKRIAPYEDEVSIYYYESDIVEVFSEFKLRVYVLLNKEYRTSGGFSWNSYPHIIIHLHNHYNDNSKENLKKILNERRDDFIKIMFHELVHADDYFNKKINKEKWDSHYNNMAQNLDKTNYVYKDRKKEYWQNPIETNAYSLEIFSKWVTLLNQIKGNGFNKDYANMIGFNDKNFLDSFNNLIKNKTYILDNLTPEQLKRFKSRSYNLWKHIIDNKNQK